MTGTLLGLTTVVGVLASGGGAAHAAPGTRKYVDRVVGVEISCPDGYTPTINRVTAADLKNMPSYAFAVLAGKRIKVDYVYMVKPRAQSLPAFTQTYVSGRAKLLSSEKRTIAGRPAYILRTRYTDGPDGPFNAVEALSLSRPDLALIQVAYMSDRSVLARDAVYKEAIALFQSSVRFLGPAD